MYASVAINANSYTNPFGLIGGSILGSVLCTAIAILVGKGWKYVGQMISYLGKNSLSIMMFHFLSFKFITFIQICFYNKPKYYLAAFPTLYLTGIWRWLYIFTGLFVPLLLNAMYKYTVIGITKQWDKRIVE